MKEEGFAVTYHGRTAGVGGRVLMFLSRRIYDRGTVYVGETERGFFDVARKSVCFCLRVSGTIVYGVFLRAVDFGQLHA